MAADIGIRIGVEGENTFKSALAGINAQLKQMDSEMKATAAAMDRMGDKEQAAAKKSDILTRSIEASNQKIDILTQQYDKAEDKLRELGTALERAKQEFGENSAEAIQAQNAYNKQAAAVAKLGTQLNNATADLNRMEAELEDLTSEAKQAENALEQLGNEADGIGGKFSGGFSVAKGALANLVADGISMAVEGIKNLASEAMQTADSLSKFEGTMAFAGFDPDEIAASKQAVQDYASKTVYDLGEVANTTAQLAANGVQDFQKLTEAAGNLNAVAGGNADTFGSVAMVMTQTAGAGKLTTENWNQLADAIPGASGEIQKALLEAGAYTGDFRDAMAKGEISAEEFNAAIMELGFSEAAVEAASSVSTIEGAVGNLQATLVDGFVKVLTDGGLMNGITGFINGFTNILAGAGQYIGPAIQSIKDSISGIGEAFRNAFGEERSAAILGFLSRLGSALVAVPFQIIAANIQIVSTLWEVLLTAAGAVVDFFTTTLPSAFQSIATAIDAVVPDISDFGSYFEAERQEISQTMENLKQNVSQAWETLKNSVKSTLENMKSAISNAWNTIKTTVSNAVSNVKTTVSTAFDAVKNNVSNALNSAKNTVTSVFDSIKTAITTKINAARDAVTGAIERIKGAFKFSWSLPPLKLPHISVKGGVAPYGIGGKGSLPKFSISWYKDGGIMMNPTIFGAAGNTLLAGGEAGPEAIAPIDLLQDYVSRAVDSTVSDVLNRLLPNQPASGTLPPIIIPLHINGKEFYRATINDLTRAIYNHNRAMGTAY